MKLYVVRHSESLGNAASIIDDNSSLKNDKNYLSDNGQKQAEELAKRLEEHKIDMVIVSPLIRTLQTVGPYLKRNKKQLIVSDLIIERNAGVFSGKPRSAMKEYFSENNITDKVSFKPEGGESILEVYERARMFLDYLKINFKDESVLVCTHVNFMRCLDIAIKGKDIMNYYPIEEANRDEIKEYTL